jgi:NitT/TauT family transport system substrate-binding protein
MAKLTPFAKLFLTVIILGVLGFTLYTFRDDLKKMAGGDNKPESAKPGTDPGGGKAKEDEATSKEVFTGVNEAGEDPPKTGVTGVTTKTVGAGKLGRPLIVAINTWAGHSPGIVANGGMSTAAGSVYDQLGVKVEFKIFDDPATKFAAFRAGEIDIMWDTVDSWAREASVMAKDKQAAKAIIMQDWSRGGDGVVSSAAIKSVEDLKGKSVSVIEFTPSHWFILYLLSQSGLSTEDKKSVKLKYFNDPAAVKAAFTSKSVDAMVSWEPFLSEALAARGEEAHMLVSTQAATNVIADVLVCSQKTIDSSPATLKAFVHGWFKGIEEMKKNPPAAYAKVAGALKLTPEDVEGMLSGLKLTPFADNAQFFGLTGSKAHFETLFNAAYQVYRRLGKTDAPVTAMEWLDASFVASLAGEPEHQGQKVVEAMPKPNTKKAKASDVGILNKQLSINFAPGSADIMPGSEFALDALGETMVSFGSTYLQVEGNTDSTGSRNVNVELSRKRADAVKNYLVKNFQLPETRFKTLGHGPDNPVAANTSEGGRQLNRRTDIKVMLAQ